VKRFVISTNGSQDIYLGNSDSKNGIFLLHPYLAMASQTKKLFNHKLLIQILKLSHNIQGKIYDLLFFPNFYEDFVFLATNLDQFGRSGLK
jgi:hypothetical protein